MQVICLLYTSTVAEKSVSFFCAFIGFVTLVPFALPSEDLHDHLNGISEVSPTLTFIIQIEIIGLDILRKVRIRSLHYLTIVAEMFCLFGFFMMIKSVVAICRPNFNLEVLEPLDSIMEDGGLFFVFVFRFYFLAMSVGIRGVLRTKSLELFAYFLFVTHDYPWDIIGYYPDASWEPAAAMWMRVTMMMCIMLTIRDKLQLEVSHNSVAGPSKDVSLKSPPNKSMGPKH
ncbi:hypothetical protein Poli38472_013358 [Pythium oligandrum]|uniref:Transmembrane protein n=1 Tax=Pythium oligandrum TaxID=41045 RepID=A0A8K1FEE9_PYTOL|nr:hypothetical protein Poli38472_013358 [Pythium oligandrum]|eukprot:TMW57884.1 hypothetical protein Poli38472_013358 [Pythium oligandrum]